MIDPAYVQVTAQVAVIPTPSCVRPRRVTGEPRPGTVAPVRAPAGDAGSRRSMAREVLEEALAGVRLGSRDSSFLSRLVHWDKRNAASVASLLSRARQAGREEAGREEAGLTLRQREVVIAALDDAAMYRAAGVAGTGCWDCENIPGNRCADHAKDNDRARAYAELADLLSGTPVQAELLPRPRDISGYRRRTPVAS